MAEQPTAPVLEDTTAPASLHYPMPALDAYWMRTDRIYRGVRRLRPRRLIDVQQVVLAAHRAIDHVDPHPVGVQTGHRIVQGRRDRVVEQGCHVMLGHQLSSGFGAGLLPGWTSLLTRTAAPLRSLKTPEVTTSSPAETPETTAT